MRTSLNKKARQDNRALFAFADSKNNNDSFSLPQNHDIKNDRQSKTKTEAQKQTKTKKQDAFTENRILPFFIPMEGCPHACVFCDQKQISSHSAPPSQKEIETAIAALKTPHEVAFYGGSFTLLPRKKQLPFLQAAAQGIKEGKISSVRLSTRPDGIDIKELDFLYGYGVRTVELGIQSTDEKVLAASGRFYDKETIFQAAMSIKKKNMRLGLQLMPGLPQSDREKDMQSALDCLKMRPDFVRIYPTLVIEKTALADMYKKGLYKPLSLENAVSLCRDSAALFLSENIPVIRLGLHNTPSLQEGLVAGPFSPAFGALVYSALALEHMRFLKAKTNCTQISAAQNYLPLLFGHNGANKNWIKENLPQGLHGDKTIYGHVLKAEDFIYEEKQFLRDFLKL